MVLLLLAACSDYWLWGKHDTGVRVYDDANCADAEGPTRAAVEIDESCAITSPPGTFTPVEEWHWTPEAYPASDQVMMTPVVTSLNGDAIPDVVFISFDAGFGDRSPGVLRALSGRSGAEEWSLQGTLGDITSVSGVAAGDLDGDGAAELFLCTLDHGLLAVGADGRERWLAPGVCESAEDYPAIHDLDGDGSAEIVVGRKVVDADGVLVAAGAGGRAASGNYGSMSFAVDTDGDGTLEIVAGNTVYGADGSVRWSSGTADGMPAVADLDGDGAPEIVVVDGAGELSCHDAATGAVVWGPTSFGGGGSGGPPTIADFDGDGAPEIGIPGLYAYTVHEADGTLLWTAPTKENSVAITGSSVFDFEGDGASEVVYADEDTLWVLDGATGAAKLAVTEHSSATVSEYPLVADVDGDDEAELLVVSNDYSLPGSTGVTLYGDADHSWVDAGRVWNQAAYFQDNVREDGTIPAHPGSPWLSHNSFRAGLSEGFHPRLLPNLGLDAEYCLESCAHDEVTVWIAVENRGVADARGVPVAVLGASGGVLASSLVDVPAGGVSWLGPYVVERDEFDLEVTADGGDATQECDEDDNVTLLAWPCE
jgi:hypothetical protein